MGSRHGLVRVLPPPMLGSPPIPAVPADVSGDPRCAADPPRLEAPAVLHKLGILRDEKTEPKKFREVVRELSWLLGYEALADARVRPLEVRTPIETMAGHELGRADRPHPDPAGGPRAWSTRCSS